MKIKKMHSRLFLTFLLLSLTQFIFAQEILSLAGSWQFEVDSEDIGTKERWFERDLTDNIFLP
ncbi:MAG: hypothetical protein IK084_00790, partial [Bacteroidaceae bacterium]|nr:hypothetical protein [Bacteroidaceae bacterium]